MHGDAVGDRVLADLAQTATLLAHANRVMYEAKRAGGGCWRLFEDTEQAADPALA